jgi:serine/threonine protein kinase
MAFDPTLSQILSRHGFSFLSVLGSGGEGYVVQCHSDRRSEDYAVKIFSFPSDSKPPEIVALESVWSPHVINVYETFQESNLCFIVLEYCPGGSLMDCVLRDGPIDYERLVPLSLEILAALRACHDRGIAHLDIKPQNILLDKLGRAKLSDFGCAQKCSDSPSHQFRGSLAFIAPEVGKHCDYDPMKADVWSLGVTFYFCAAGQMPWAVNSEEFLRAHLYGLESADPIVNRDFLKILRRMIVANPSERASLDEVETSLGCLKKLSLTIIGRRKSLIESGQVQRARTLVASHILGLPAAQQNLGSRKVLVAQSSVDLF